MQRFIHRYADRITGVVSGFDRLVFRGYLRRLAYPAGMRLFLNVRRIWFKDFGRFVHRVSERLKDTVTEEVRRQGRPVQYLASSATDKEALARGIAARDGITDGLVALLTCVEPCLSYRLGPHPKTHALELRPAMRKCLHLYTYAVDPVFGFMHARIQTWFPFTVQICLNGREWLARQMDQAGVRYERRDNCFPWIADVPRAQRLLARQVTTDWPRALDRIARRLNPLHREIFRGFPADYYWTAYQSEWATDLMFRDTAALRAIYPALARHAITAFGSGDVMRFLGGKVHGGFRGQIVSDFKDRPEGIRVKHAVNGNSVKLYDKQGSVLRTETTINAPQGIKVFRPTEGDHAGVKAWRPMRKGIADLHRRTEVSQATNARYLDAMAAADTTTPLEHLVAGLARPVTWKGRRVRGLRPWAAEDLRLLRAVTRGEFCLNGFRNRDLQALLFDRSATDRVAHRRRSARVTRLIRLLRAHGLVGKLSRTHRYRVTERGRETLTALLAAQTLTLRQLNEAAA